MLTPVLTERRYLNPTISHVLLQMIFVEAPRKDIADVLNDTDFILEEPKTSIMNRVQEKVISDHGIRPNEKSYR